MSLIESKIPVMTLIFAEMGDKQSAEKSLNQLASILESNESLPSYFREGYVRHLRRIAIDDPLSFFRPKGKRYPKNIRVKLETYFKVEKVISKLKADDKFDNEDDAIAKCWEQENELRPCKENTMYKHYYEGKKLFKDHLQDRGSDVFARTLNVSELAGGITTDK